MCFLKTFRFTAQFLCYSIFLLTDFITNVNLLLWILLLFPFHIHNKNFQFVLF